MSRRTEHDRVTRLLTRLGLKPILTGHSQFPTAAEFIAVGGTQGTRQEAYLSLSALSHAYPMRIPCVSHTCKVTLAEYQHAVEALVKGTRWQVEPNHPTHYYLSTPW